MKLHITFVITSLLLLSACGFDQNENNSTNDSPVMKSVKAKDRWMVDDSGRVLMIHGVNQVNKQPPYDAISVGFDKEDAELLKSYGFNAVRLGVMWAAIEPNKGEYDLSYLESIRQTVKLLKEQGVYSLLDFHQDAFSLKHGGSGFPSWAALGEGNTSSASFPMMYFDPFHTSVPEDFDHFWNDKDGIQSSYMDMLTLVVRTLGNEDGVLGVEFINEPFPGTDWTKCRQSFLEPLNFSLGCEAFDSGHLTNFYNEAIRRVRAINKDIMVVYDENTLGGIGAPPHIGMMDDNNTLFSWHNYMPTDFSSIFKHADDFQKLSKSAILMTEFGASQKVDEWSEVLSLSDTNLMSWMFWAYTNNPPYKIAAVAGFGADGRTQGLVYDASQPMDANLTDANKSIVRDVNLDVQRIEALSRPYPQWTAGIPKLISYDENSSAFSFAWSYNENVEKNVDTVIFVPKHHYPNGYKISVKNCNVISGPPNNQSLVLRNAMEIKDFDAEVIIMPLNID